MMAPNNCNDARCAMCLRSDTENTTLFCDFDEISEDVISGIMLVSRFCRKRLTASFRSSI